MKIKVNPAYQAASILSLSAREFEIFCDIACGITPQHTAEKYRLSVKTVSTYRARIIDKLGVRSNQEIAVIAYRAGITQVEDEIQTHGSESTGVQEELDFGKDSKSSEPGGDTQGSGAAVGTDSAEMGGEVV